MKVEVQFGAMAPELSEQLTGWPKEFVDHAQKDADAITRLKIQGLITSRQADAARDRLFKRILKKAPKP